METNVKSQWLKNSYQCLFRLAIRWLKTDLTPQPLMNSKIKFNRRFAIVFTLFIILLQFLCIIRVQALQENGLLNFYLNRVMVNFWLLINILTKLISNLTLNKQPRIDQCLMQNNRASTIQKSLSLVDMACAFVIFGLGITLSFFVFLLELIFSKIGNILKFNWHHR